MSDTPNESPPAEPTANESGESNDSPAEDGSTDNKDWRDEARRKGNENKNLRARLKAAEEAAEEAKLSGMTEAQRLVAEAEARGAAQKSDELLPRLRGLVLTAAAQGKLIEPGIAATLVGNDIDLDDDKEVALAIDAIVKKFPGLAKSADNGNGSAPHQGGSFDQGPRGKVEPKSKSMNDFLMDSLNGQT
jgi:hypothetical protein